MLVTITRDELKRKLGHRRTNSFYSTRDENLHSERCICREQSTYLQKKSARAPETLPDKDAEIVVYCGNAPCKRSDRAAERLLDLGYTQVRDYHEGMDDWMEAGLPMERGEITEATSS